MLEDAVRLQMRSDVPVGLFLSAGIDSNALLAMMSEHSDRPIHTFTIGFEEGESSNETDDARAMARKFGADHSEMIVGPRDYQEYYKTVSLGSGRTGRQRERRSVLLCEPDRQPEGKGSAVWPGRG